MLARIYSCAVVGLEGVIVEVETDTTQGFPGMDIVGLPDAAVKESAARVQTAIRNAGLPYPRERIVVNLAPASVRKEGPAYDLPIALGIVMMEGSLNPGYRQRCAHRRRTLAGWHRPPCARGPADGSESAR